MPNLVENMKSIGKKKHPRSPKSTDPQRNSETAKRQRDKERAKHLRPRHWKFYCKVKWMRTKFIRAASRQAFSRPRRVPISLDAVTAKRRWCPHRFRFSIASFAIFPILLRCKFLIRHLLIAKASFYSKQADFIRERHRSKKFRLVVSSIYLRVQISFISFLGFVDFIEFRDILALFWNWTRDWWFPDQLEAFAIARRLYHDFVLRVQFYGALKNGWRWWRQWFPWGSR